MGNLKTLLPFMALFCVARAIHAAISSYGDLFSSSFFFYASPFLLFFSYGRKAFYFTSDRNRLIDTL